MSDSVIATDLVGGFDVCVMIPFEDAFDQFRCDPASHCFCWLFDPS